MKNRHITVVLIALSLIAITFVSTAAAATYYATMSGWKNGKNFTFTIDTTSAKTIEGNVISNFGNDVDPNTIVITIYDTKGNLLPPVTPDPSSISLSADQIVIQLVKQDGLPSHASAINAVGTLTGQYTGNTFFASGPGWAWGGIHE